MGQLLLLTIGALVVGAIGFGVAVLVSGSDPGLTPVDPEGRAVPLPADRPLAESDLVRVRFDTAVRGYRMDQVDAALRRAAYDVGYKGELIGVLEAEIEALRAGRRDDADKLRAARAAALSAAAGSGQAATVGERAGGTGPDAAAGDRESAGRESPDRESAGWEPADREATGPVGAGPEVTVAQSQPQPGDAGDYTPSHRTEEMRLP